MQRGGVGAPPPIYGHVLAAPPLIKSPAFNVSQYEAVIPITIWSTPGSLHHIVILHTRDQTPQAGNLICAMIAVDGMIIHVSTATIHVLGHICESHWCVQ